LTGAEIRRRRVTDRIPLHVVAGRAGVSRGRFSEIESGLVTPRPEEIERIDQALNSLIAARKKVLDYAEQVGWPIPA